MSFRQGDALGNKRGKRIKELTEEYDAIKSEVLQKMIENKDKSFDTGKS